MAHSIISPDFSSNSNSFVKLPSESRVQLTELRPTARAPETKLVGTETSTEQSSTYTSSVALGENGVETDDLSAGKVSDGESLAETASSSDGGAIVVSATSSAEPATWSARVEWVDPDTLSDHSLWRDTLGFEPSECEEALVEFARDAKSLHAIIVTGAGCASGPDVILDGHRRRYAAVAARTKLVAVIRRTELTATAEETIMLQAALSSTHARKLKPSQLAALESRLHRLYAKPSGFRSDLETSVGSNGGSEMAGDSLTLVAKASGEPRNAIANRHKVFNSPVSPAALKQAVDAGALSLTAGADLVRTAEKVEAVQATLRGHRSVDSESPELSAAKTELEAQVRAEIGKPKNSKKNQPKGRTEPRAQMLRLPLGGDAVRVLMGATTFLVRAVAVTATDVEIEMFPDSGRETTSELSPIGSPAAEAGESVSAPGESSPDAPAHAVVTDESAPNGQQGSNAPVDSSEGQTDSRQSARVQEPETASPDAPPPDAERSDVGTAKAITAPAVDNGEPAHTMDSSDVVVAEDAPTTSVASEVRSAVPPRWRPFLDVLKDGPLSIVQVVEAMGAAGTLPSSKRPNDYVGQELSYAASGGYIARVARGVYRLTE